MDPENETRLCTALQEQIPLEKNSTASKIEMQTQGPVDTEIELTEKQELDISRMQSENLLLSRNTAIEIVRQFQAEMDQVPDYFDGDDLSDEKLPPFLRGYRYDKDKAKITKDETNLFIYEGCVLPPNREDLFSPDNVPGLLKDFEVDTRVMRLTNYEPWTSPLRSISPDAKKLIYDVCQKNLKLDLIEPSQVENLADDIRSRAASQH
jgi:hypothetical protein